MKYETRSLTKRPPKTMITFLHRDEDLSINRIRNTVFGVCVIATNVSWPRSGRLRTYLKRLPTLQLSCKGESWVFCSHITYLFNRGRSLHHYFLHYLPFIRVESSFHYFYFSFDLKGINDTISTGRHYSCNFSKFYSDKMNLKTTVEFKIKIVCKRYVQTLLVTYMVK